MHVRYTCYCVFSGTLGRLTLTRVPHTDIHRFPAAWDICQSIGACSGSPLYNSWVRCCSIVLFELICLLSILYILGGMFWSKPSVTESNTFCHRTAKLNLPMSEFYNNNYGMFRCVLSYFLCFVEYCVLGFRKEPLPAWSTRVNCPSYSWCIMNSRANGKDFVDIDKSNRAATRRDDKCWGNKDTKPETHVSIKILTMAEIWQFDGKMYLIQLHDGLLHKHAPQYIQYWKQTDQFKQNNWTTSYSTII